MNTNYSQQKAYNIYRYITLQCQQTLLSTYNTVVKERQQPQQKH